MDIFEEKEQISNEIKMDKYDKLLLKIEYYKKLKTDTIFDSFYHTDLWLMEDCIKYKQKADESEK